MNGNTDMLIRRLLGQGDPEGNVVFFDIETYQGEQKLLEKEMAWYLRDEYEKAAVTKEQLDNANEGIKRVMQEAHDKGKEPYKKDLSPYQKVIDDHEKILEKIAEKENTFLEKAALKDSARIISIACCMGNERHICHVTPLAHAEKEELADLHIIEHQCADEKELLQQFMGILDDWSPIKHLVSFNGFHFDLPKVRLRSGFYQVKKAECFSRGTMTKQIDLCYEFQQYYTTGTKSKLGFVADMFGLDSSKIGDGAEVAELFETGEYVTLLAYNMYDAVILQDIYARMY